MYVSTLDETGKTEVKINKISKPIFIIGIISIVLFCFVPSTVQAYRIFGIGGTIDYLNNNPDVKALPDKTIKLLNKWADETLQNDSIK